jgi:tetratricopeptide (TPR) repeat protein
MKTLKFFLSLSLLWFSIAIVAQKSTIYTDDLKDYNHAIDLYFDKDYVASQQLFKQVRNQFDANSENKATCDYYIAFAALRLNDRNGDELMQDFVENYPTSTKRNDAYREVSNYYYDYGKYSEALKWFKNVDSKGLTRQQEEDFNFKYGYALFSLKKYKEAKAYFAPLLDSPKYGSQAKYYSGYMALQNEDYNNADKYLDQVDDKNLGKDIPYFKATVKFKTGQFQEAIDIAEPYLNSANRKQKSDVAKIIGESYFNLGKYGKAIPFLTQYKGKHGKWNNSDYYQLGYAYYMQQDYGNAISWFNKIIGSKSAVGQNASYHLAECYVKSGKKQEALNAFRNALEMDYNADIKKNAWLNYAKLSYEIGNPLKSVPDVLTAYLEKYPKSAEVDEINELLVSSYVTSKDYDGALKLLKNKNDSKSKEIYQKVAFYKGVQLFNDAKYNDALELFNKSLNKKINPIYTAKATYWKAESNYILNKFSDALNGFKSFTSLPSANETEVFSNIDYNIAYANFKLKDYPKSIEYFQKFTDNQTDITTEIKDAYLRLGDSYFITSNYYKAMEAYNFAIKNKSKNLDYAYFQKAISYGFVGKNNRKIETLNEFLSKFKTSKYRDEAFYSLGIAYTKAKEKNKAINAFEEVLKFKKSSLRPKALLKQGLIYFNSNQGEKALVKYKKLVRDYPQSPEARQAVNNARQIYINLGRVEEYAAWVQNIDFIEVSDSELDNTMFESADIQYQQNNQQKAIKGFKQYLARFPKGIHALQANFYLAEMYYSQNKLAQTKPYYEYIINQEPNEYTEQALTRLSQVLLSNKDWDKAIPVLKRLENEAKNEQNILYAQSNLMKGNYSLEKYTDAVAYAEKILQQANLDDTVKTDAKIIIARSAIKTGNLTKAKQAYQEVALIAQGELKAESIYYDAYFKNKEGLYQDSKVQIDNLNANYSTYKKWSVKGLVVMAKNFYGMKDAFQATVVLEAVIKRFKGDEMHKEAVADAETTLQKIKSEESKTNASVVPD